MSGSKDVRIEAESGECEDEVETEEVDEVESGVEDEKKGCEYDMEDGEVDEDEWCKRWLVVEFLICIHVFILSIINNRLNKSSLIWP